MMEAFHLRIDSKTTIAPYFLLKKTINHGQINFDQMKMGHIKQKLIKFRRCL